MKTTPTKYARALHLFAARHSKEEIDELIKHLAKDALRTGKMAWLTRVVAELKGEARAASGVTTLNIRVAGNEDAAAVRTQLAQVLYARGGDKVDVVVQEDPSLIGGVIVTTDKGIRINASLAARLEDLRQKFNAA